MDRCKGLAVGALVAVMMLSGCGGSASSDKSASGPAIAPDKAIAQFLEAVRTGNDTTAAQMLTAIARRKTAELQLVVAPPGSDTASFTVGEVELSDDKKGAQVASTWTDIVEDGKPHTDTIVWILRLDPEGWRISGMGTRLFDDMAPLVLNFEDPEDMVNKQKMAEAEIARRANAQSAAAAQAQKPPAGTAPPTVTK